MLLAGLIIEFTDPHSGGRRTATFLPEVAAHEGWDKQQVRFFGAQVAAPLPVGLHHLPTSARLLPSLHRQLTCGRSVLHLRMSSLLHGQRAGLPSSCS